MVSDSLSADERCESVDTHTSLSTYTKTFNEVFPYYLSIGMTYDQFWYDDPELVIYYRKAEEIRIERKNQELWLQGMYIYEALCDVSPVLHAFAKKGTKPNPYSMKPYPVTQTTREKEKENRERKIAEKGKKMLEAFMSTNNKKFKEKSQPDFNKEVR